MWRHDGALSRYAIALSLATLTPFFFTATLVVNLLGAFGIGFIFRNWRRAIDCGMTF
ncbi:hypothetical protein [Salinicoccus sp. CNSTN-B1]